MRAVLGSHKSRSSFKLQVSTQAGVEGGGAVWGDAAGKFVRGGVGARGGDFIVLLQRQNVVSHGPARCSPVVSDSLCCSSLPRVDTPAYLQSTHNVAADTVCRAETFISTKSSNRHLSYSKIAECGGLHLSLTLTRLHCV